MSEKPIFRVGIMSDNQSYDYEQDWGMSNTIKALKLFREYKIDVLMNAGDIGDGGDDTKAIRFYEKQIHDIFGEKQPVQVTCAGNHDFWGKTSGRTQEVIYQDFCDALNEPCVDPICKTINGYDFIAFSTNNEVDYSEDACEKLLRPALEKAVKRDSTKPIFVVTHYQPSKTCSGSASGRMGLRKVMNDFPQVVSFSGHSHNPLEDERCIWQGEFTAINTSTLSYGCIDERCANVMGPILPFGREVVEVMVMDVFADRLEIHRFNIEDGHEIKPEHLWKVALPYSPDNPVYSIERRAAERTAPVFPVDTKLIFRIDYGFIYLVFNEAKHDDLVYMYKVVATELRPDGTKGEPIRFQYVAHFYRLLRNRDTRYVFRIPPKTLEKAKTYLFEVYPVEAFGKMGEPITLIAPVPPTYTIANVPEIGPQE